MKGQERMKFGEYAIGGGGAQAIVASMTSPPQRRGRRANYGRFRRAARPWLCGAWREPKDGVEGRDSAGVWVAAAPSERPPAAGVAPGRGRKNRPHCCPSCRRPASRTRRRGSRTCCRSAGRAATVAAPVWRAGSGDRRGSSPRIPRTSPGAASPVSLHEAANPAFGRGAYPRRAILRTFAAARGAAACERAWDLVVGSARPAAGEAGRGGSMEQEPFGDA